MAKDEKAAPTVDAKSTEGSVDKKDEKIEAPEKETVPAPADKGESYNGKSSVLKWVVIYVLIGAVIYGAWYYFSVVRSADATNTTTNSLY